jgi:topoisomerase IV subunit A
MDEQINPIEPIAEDNTKLSHVSDLYQSWFLDYASYVILERAIPALEDGMKPVQRRILHAMKETDDGRFQKVANIIGNTMQYHPHGDAAIGEATVNLGQKNLLIDTQGNWGDVVTGDSAAAPRYIEARLSKLALDICFNSDLTEWQLSYDGRKKEPVMLPIKFPTLLAMGTEGIAVGLATKILPHNFQELIKASINILNEKEFTLLPDFPTYGLADFTNYNQGARGGRVRIRSKIEVVDRKTLVIKNAPFGVTTTSLIESIVKANETGKIKIRQIIDNTAKDVEILIELPKGVSPDVTIDALYAFTNCEVSISPNACVIYKDKPIFLTVNECLRLSTENTVSLLKLELEINRDHLLDKLHFASLEKIFIEKRIYRDIEECETWESVIDTIDIGLKKYIKDPIREISKDDIANLTEIKIKRISKFDSRKADENILNIQAQIDEIEYNLRHLTEYAIEFFENLLTKYGKGRERKTEIRTFDNIEVKTVAVANKKLFVNRKEGFIGFSLKKDELVGDCSEFDDIIVFRKDGKLIVVKVDEKVFVGKDIIHVAIFNKDDERMTYNLVYLDGKSSKAMVKRFNVSSVTRGKEYDITQGHHNQKVLYFTANPLGETEVVTVFLAQSSKARNKVFDFDMAKIAIKGRNSIGNILTKYAVRKIIRKSVDTSNVKGIDVWYDENIGRLTSKEIGKYLGNFTPDDFILAIYNDGNYELTNTDPLNHFDIDKLLHIEQFVPERVITAVYFNAENNNYFVKRFTIETTTTGKMFRFINDNQNSRLLIVSTGSRTIIKFDYIEKKTGEKKNELTELSEFVDVMGWKAAGKKVAFPKITNIKLVDIIYEEDTNGNDETNGDENTDEVITSSNEVVAEENISESIEIIETNVDENVADVITSSNKDAAKESISESIEIIDAIVQTDKINKTKPRRKKSIIIPEVSELPEEPPTESVTEEFTEIEFGLKQKKLPPKKASPPHHSKGKKKGPEETQLSLF